MTISQKIYTLRRTNGLSQEEFAAAVGVSRQAVSKWEQAAALPDIDSLVKISEYFGVTVDCIVKDYMELDSVKQIQNSDKYHMLKCFYTEKLQKPFMLFVAAVTAVVGYNQLLIIVKPPLDHPVWRFALGLGAPMWKLWLVVAALAAAYLWFKNRCKSL